ncbi:MAG: hypothetical protein ACJ73S_28350 [Mycobacteriales bacterium]
MRVVVVSSDKFNELTEALPHVVPIVRRSASRGPAGYAARLGDADPIAGVAVVGEAAPIHPRFAGAQVGMLTGATMEVIGSALRDLYDLN